MMNDEVQKHIYFSSPEEAIPIITELLVKEDFKTLASYYNLTDTEVKLADLESGDFFIRKKRPKSSHPAISWRYKHPFSPGFTYNSARKGSRENIYVIRVKIIIEQGAGSPNQEGYDSFYMIKSSKGWQILTDPVDTDDIMPPSITGSDVDPMPPPSWQTKDSNPRGKHATVKSTVASSVVTPSISEAIKAGDITMLKKLIKDGADIHARFDEKLLKHRVDTGFTFIQLAILVSKPGNSRVKMSVSGSAITRGREEVAWDMILLLSEDGADIHAVTKTGLTAL
ncbi:MAG: hypothetical protein V3U02_10050, partial [Calditrichia bacterium]